MRIHSLTQPVFGLSNDKNSFNSLILAIALIAVLTTSLSTLKADELNPIRTPVDFIGSICKDKNLQNSMDARLQQLVSESNLSEKQVLGEVRRKTRIGVFDNVFHTTDTLLEKLLPYIDPAKSEQYLAEMLALSSCGRLKDPSHHKKKLMQMLDTSRSYRKAYPILFYGNGATGGIYQNVLRDSYEYMLLKNFQLAFNSRLLRERFDIKKMPRIDYPIFQIGASSTGKTMSYDAKLSFLMKENPLLYRETDTAFGVIGWKELGEKIFATSFLDVKNKLKFTQKYLGMEFDLKKGLRPKLLGNMLSQQFYADLVESFEHLEKENHIGDLFALNQFIIEHKLWLPGEINLEEDIYGLRKLSFNQRRYLAYWQIFARELLEPLTVEKALMAQAKKQVQKTNIEHIYKTANSSVLKIKTQRQKMCKARSIQFLESSTPLTVSFLSTVAEKEQTDAMLAVCRTKWGNNARKEIESYLMIGSVLGSLGGTALATSLGLPGLIVNAIIYTSSAGTAVSGALTTNRLFTEMRFEEALGYTTVAEQNIKRTSIFYNAILTALYPLAFANVGRQLKKGEYGLIIPDLKVGLKYFLYSYIMATSITIKEFIEAGYNPLKKPEFYADLAGMYFSALSGSNVIISAGNQLWGKVIIDVFTTMISASVAGNLHYMVTKQDPSPVYGIFNIHRWAGDKSFKSIVDRLFKIWGANLAKNKFVASLPFAGPVLREAIFASWLYTRLIWLNHAAVEYYYNSEKGFYESWLSIRPKDFIPNWSSDAECIGDLAHECATSPYEGKDLTQNIMKLSPEQLAALQHILHINLNESQKKQLNELLPMPQ